MELFFISFLGTLILVLLGSILQTTSPDFFSETFQTNASAITLGSLGISTSILLMMILLKARIREGFEEQTFANQWNHFVAETNVSDVCKLYTEMYEKIMIVEKGAPPEPIKSDAQAREATDRQFSAVMTLPPVSCSLFQEVEAKKKNLDSFFVEIQKVPDTFFAQVVETAIGCRSLLIVQVLKVKEAEREQKEGFEDIPLCSDTEIQERKAFKERKPLSKEAQQCVLVEEIPPEKKISVINAKLNTMRRVFQSYRANSKVKDSIQKILDDAMYYKNELDTKKKEAEATSNKYNW